MIASYLVIYALYWFNGKPASIGGFGLLCFLLIGWYVNRTIGRPTLTVYVAERNFLEEELGTSATSNNK